jgi:primosomal protein N' (replication factor Y) (superfamily II helicase)
MSQSIAKVEPLTTARALRGPYDYRVPARLGEVGVGTLLEVPFGHQRLLGVVVDMADRSAVPAARLVEPIAALEAGVPAELVELGLWVAREYCSTPARGLELVLPPGTTTVRGQTPARTETVAVATASAATALGPEGGSLGPVQRRALELLVADGAQVGAGTLAEAGVARDALLRLERRGLVELSDRQVHRRPVSVAVGALSGPVELSVAQRAAADRIVATLDADGGELLLHGVTGSGKTEVYLAAAEQAIARGRGVIVLVPEIAMTPQALARFEARFGDGVAILHSKLSAGERRDEWHRLRSGEARICVGPRSAIFAPIDGLGLIVVDEEHDGSYKQEGDPKYDAREVARRRATEAGAALVLGSATPRPESWSALERIELSERVDGRDLPPVEVIDMRDRDGRLGALHPRTRAALAELGETGGKAIVLVNRRGWAPHLACRSCGWVAECPQCDVSLVVHRAGQPCRCHHCGHSEPLPASCPECGSVTLARAGAGTQRIEELIADATGGLQVFRLDADSAARIGGHLEILAAFEAADSGVLVGTQMVAKGHDFPDVVLAVVVDADATLRFPDFRAEERTFALVAQLAGRSGRGELGGRVIVQTLTPDAPAIRHAAAHDAAGFVAGELERRRELGYPPFAHVIRIELGAVDGAHLQSAAEALRAALDKALPDGAKALGPAPRFRLRGRERRQIVVKAAERASAVAAIRETVHAEARAKRLREIRISVDVDAQ